MSDFDFGIEQPTTSGTVPASVSIGPQQPRPTRPAQMTPAATHETAGPGWFFLFVSSFAWCLAGIIIGVAASNFHWSDIVPNPSPLRDGTYILFHVEDDDWKDLPPEQQAIRNSVPLRKWIDDHCTIEKIEDGSEAAAARWFDKDANLENESDEWRKLVKSVTLDPPSVAVSHAGRVKEFKLPKDVGTTIKALEAVVK